MLHVVEAGFCGVGEFCGDECASCEVVSVVCFVCEFDAFALADEGDGVLADDVSASERVDADLFLGTFADDAFSSVGGVVVVVEVECFCGAFCESDGGSAGAVFFEVVVYVDDFDVVVEAECFGDLRGELEEEVYAYAHIGCVDDGDFFGEGV